MIDDEGAGPVRAELDHLAATAPPVSFTAGDLIGRGRRRRQVRRGTAIGGAAAALALVVALPVALRADPGPGDVVVAGSTGAAPTPRPEVTPTGAPAPRVPGLTPARAEQIARGCALVYGGRDGQLGGPTTSPGPNIPVTPTAAPTPPAEGSLPPDPSVSPTRPGPTPSPTPASPTPARPTPRPTGAEPSVTPGVPSPTPVGWRAAPRLQDSVRVYNHIRDGAGEHALVYGPYDVLSCDIGESAQLPYNAGGASGQDTRWLPGPVSVDQQGSTPGGVRHSGDTVPVGRGYDLVEGRVGRDVARLEVRIGSDRMTVTPVNGTYIARFVRTTTWRPDPARDWTITAYDRNGTELTTLDPMPTGCFVAPTGEVVYGPPDTPRLKCRPAQLWGG